MSDEARAEILDPEYKKEVESLYQKAFMLYQELRSHENLLLLGVSSAIRNLHLEICQKNIEQSDIDEFLNVLLLCKNILTDREVDNEIALSQEIREFTSQEKQDYLKLVLNTTSVVETYNRSYAKAYQKFAETGTKESLIFLAFTEVMRVCYVTMKMKIKEQSEEFFDLEVAPRISLIQETAYLTSCY